MTITTSTVEPGIVAVTVNYPPVNAIPSAGWFELADAITAAGRDRSTHVVILRAEGRGFNAGVDIKEMQRTEGFGALIDANRGCFEAFRAVYECAVPVVAAVNGFCVGGGSASSATPTSSSPPTTRSSGYQRWSVERSARPPTFRGLSPAHDAPPVLHRGHRRRGHAAPVRVGARGGAPRRTRRVGTAGGARHRRQRHPGDSRRKGGS